MKEKKHAPSIRRKKPILPIVLILVAAIILAALPQITKQRNAQENPSIVSAQVQAATLNTVIRAGGTLTDREAESVELPEDVELTFVVKNGDVVKAGDLVATVDKESLMITIAQLQEKLASMDERIEKAMDEDTAAKVTAPVSGRVKAIYAQEGQEITDIMYEHGVLASLSLDGLMALDLSWSEATVGTAVSVTLSDGEVVSGKVDSIAGSTVTVTLSDEKAQLGEAVTVADAEGNVIGGGALYIHQALSVTGYYGQVEEVSVEVGDKLDAGDALMTLANAESAAGYAGLLTQRGKMEEQMTLLFTLYQTGGLFAESDGIVTEISDEDNLEAVMASQASYRLQNMVNSPDGNEGYTNYAASVTSLQENNLSLMLCPVTISALDYADRELLENLPYTQITGYTLDNSVPVFVWENNAWVMKDLTEIKAEDKLILAFGDSMDMPVWIVCHHSAEEQPGGENQQPGGENQQPGGENQQPGGENQQPGGENQQPGGENQQPGGENQQPGGESQQPGGENQQHGGENQQPGGENQQPGGENQQPGGENQSPNGNTQQRPGGNMQMPSGSGNSFGSGMSGSMNVSDMLGQIPTVEAAADLILEEVVVYTLTPDKDMTVELMIDEMDLQHISLGQEVAVVLDALPEKTLTAVVTNIADASDTESGSAKYAVEITLERLLEMRSGMNAAVTFSVSSVEAACTVPAAALIEKGGKTTVYTSYDKETDTLGDPVEVTTGLSDGETVEILTGLSAGDTVYYSYTEIIEYEFVQ